MAGHPGNATNGPDVGPLAGTDPNPIGHYITLEADGVDVYVAFVDSIAHGNTLTPASVSTVTNNALTTGFTANGMWKIPSGDKQPFLIPQGPNNGSTPAGNASKCRYLAFMTASGSGYLRMYQSSQ